MKEKNEFSLGRLKYDVSIINHEKIPNRDDGKEYQNAVNELFKSIQIMMDIALKYPNISAKAYDEVYKN